MPLTHEQRLRIISKSWGKQNGFCFFPWIDGDVELTGDSDADRRSRIKAYHEGRAFQWPTEKEQILEHITAHEGDDLYWCPSLFEKKARRNDYAMDEHALWADLDAVDPSGIQDYPPTYAWESSPGRFQALWILSAGDIQGASWPGNENQKLTYHLGADPSGWDTTQLLRLPEWPNHKPEYRAANGGDPVEGRLVIRGGRTYLSDDFEDLPAVQGAVDHALVGALESEVENIDKHEVWGRVRLKVSKTVRDMVAAREPSGDRSEGLWHIIGALADQGLSPLEIVSVVRDTVWNKFSGRQDEFKRLITEANKAVERFRGKEKEKKGKDLEQAAVDMPMLFNLGEQLADVKPPKWLVDGLFAQGACGFIAGQPKSFKSWCGLDLAISVATGAPFLDYFDIVDPGPVLYIQAEDGKPTVKQRYDKVLPGKRMDKMKVTAAGIVWEPAAEGVNHPPILAMVGGDETFTISNPTWQSWLDDVLAKGYPTPDGVEDAAPFKLLILDPLMMMAGDVEENRAQEMTEKVFKPLKQLARKHDITLVVVHHMRKQGDARGPAQRGGQLMLGSVANHAWSEDSLYLTFGRYNTVVIETESKHAPTGRYELKNLRSRSARGKTTWEPRVESVIAPEDAGAGEVKKSRNSNTAAKRAVGRPKKQPEDESGDRPVGTRGRPRNTNPNSLKALRKLQSLKPGRPFTTDEITQKVAEIEGVKPTQTVKLRVYQQLKGCYDHDQVKRVEKMWMMPDATIDAAEMLEV